MSAPVLTAIRLAADAAAWGRAGFSAGPEGMVVGHVALTFAAGDGGILDWALTDVHSAGVDGLPTRLGSPPAPGHAVHENGVTEIDHVVVATPSLARTRGCLEEAGIECRRVHEGETGTGQRRRLAFFRVGRPVLEVIEAPELETGAPAAFWGITFTTADIDQAAAVLGERLGRVKEAVQPGRHIATFRRNAGLGLPVALISPTLPR